MLSRDVGMARERFHSHGRSDDRDSFENGLVCI